MPTGTKPVPGPLSHHVARVLTREMARQHKRQIEVAPAVGMSPSQLSRTLAARKVLTIDQLHGLCDYLGLSISEVVTMDDAAGSDLPRIGVRPAEQNDRAVAKQRSSDRGGDDGHG
ncbi:helix-turn-helix domain-containing protein [Microbacterium radiodurans]|uniref:Helix-turn-helix transcriptional regulator n=1 Tax=Microbacterium radiodurans TaxID=661398 RepID=A0A5J5ISP3_9MICO|nr:helix-turn-helix transcriptional regulator [Microbacterium radiodurans]KAA9085374.1 helix-turn-helix transcriptional regulator [Microbacterium radiodurans]